VRRKVYRILEVSLNGARPVAGEIVPRRCEKCGEVWAQVRLLPYLIDHTWVDRYDAALIRIGCSRSGAHYAQLTEGGVYYPTRPRGSREFVVFGRLKVIPSVYADGQALAVWTEDLPFGHEAALVGSPHGYEEEDLKHVPECGACFRDRVLKHPDYVQGRLHVVCDHHPRLNPYGEGVKAVFCPPNNSVLFESHEITVVTGTGWVAIRGDLATVCAKGVKISSPSHPDLYIEGECEQILNMHLPRR
jgi:hypothetical protein